jgi:hypothetical protein
MSSIESCGEKNGSNSASRRGKNVGRIVGVRHHSLVEIGEQPKKGYPTRISLFLLAMKSKPGQWYLPYLSFLFYHARGSKEQTLPGPLYPK